MPAVLHQSAFSSGNLELLKSGGGGGGGGGGGRADPYLAKTLSALRAQRVPPEVDPTNPYAAVPAWQYVPPKHAGDKRRRGDAEFGYDPDAAGGFPPRAATLDREYAWAENDGDLEDEHPLAWVPGGEGEQDHVQALHYLQSEHNPVRQAPLGLFDDPALDLVPAEDRIADARDAEPGLPGARAFSRFYDNHGAFAWADCFVTEYDRCVRAGEGAPRPPPARAPPPLPAPPQPAAWRACGAARCRRPCRRRRLLILMLTPPPAACLPLLPLHPSSRAAPTTATASSGRRRARASGCRA